MFAPGTSFPPLIAIVSKCSTDPAVSLCSTSTGRHVVSDRSFKGAANATSNGLIRPEDRQEPRSPSRNGCACFFPCREEAAFLAEDKKAGLSPSSAVLRA